MPSNIFLCGSGSVGDGTCCVFHKHCLEQIQRRTQAVKKPPSRRPWTTGLKRMAQTAAVVISVIGLILCLVLQPSSAPALNARTDIPPSLASRFGVADEEIRTPPPVEQEDLFISVKTSKKFHRKRLDVVVKTWFQLARDQVWFFTDGPDADLHAKTNGHLTVTQCPKSHSRQALCCKMAAEFNAFLQSGKKWFCHFDDDNYVNVPALVRKLREFDYRQDHYLGKPSIAQPLEILDREHQNHRVSFLFATGGAGFCLSRSIAQKMTPIAGGVKFEEIGDKIRLPDDVTMGYIAEKLVSTPLTIVQEFHSHLEPQRMLDVDDKSFRDQISFSYSQYGDEKNVLWIQGLFDESEDPTRFKSLHCKLFPNFSWCPTKRKAP